MVRKGIVFVLVGLVLIGGIGSYFFFQPHRDVQQTDADYVMKSSELVKEYLNDNAKANAKYLAEDGESKVVEVTGIVAEMTTDMNDQKVVLLQGEGEDAGVSCTFTAETNANARMLSIGDRIGIKGVIRSGAGYDEDLELYENVIMEKCDVVATYK